MKGVSPVLQKLIRSNKACGPFQQKLTTSFDKTGLTEINFFNIKDKNFTKSLKEATCLQM